MQKNKCCTLINTDLSQLPIEFASMFPLQSHGLHATSFFGSPKYPSAQSSQSRPEGKKISRKFNQNHDSLHKIPAYPVGHSEQTISPSVCKKQGPSSGQGHFLQSSTVPCNAFPYQPLAQLSHSSPAVLCSQIHLPDSASHKSACP